MYASSTTLCREKVTPLTCYNFDTNNPITIIFGRSVTKKVRNQTMLCFPTPPVWCFSITLRKEKPRRQRTGTLCVQHSPTAAALSTSFLLYHVPNSPYSWTHWLQDLGSHRAAPVWLVSQKDRRNQAATGWFLAMQSEKYNFRVSLFYQVVQKHKLFEVA